MSREVNPRKAAVIGCGFVGSATAFTLMQSRLFSELVLLDVNMEKADGEAKDIAHGIPFAGQMKIYAGTYDDAADAAIIIITAGANQKPGVCSVCVNSCNIVSIFIAFLQKAGEQCSPLHGLTEYIISHKLLYHTYDLGKVITAGIQKLFCSLVRL